MKTADRTDSMDTLDPECLELAELILDDLIHNEGVELTEAQQEYHARMLAGHIQGAVDDYIARADWRRDQ